MLSIFRLWQDHINSTLKRYYVCSAAVLFSFCIFTTSCVFINKHLKSYIIPWNLVNGPAKLAGQLLGFMWEVRVGGDFICRSHSHEITYKHGTQGLSFFNLSPTNKWKRLRNTMAYPICFTRDKFFKEQASAEKQVLHQAQDRQLCSAARKKILCNKWCRNNCKLIFKKWNGIPTSHQTQKLIFKTTCIHS